MDSTIEHMEITPRTPFVFVTGTTQLIATAKDAAGNVVMTWPANIHWSSPDKTVSVNSTGLLTGLSTGSARVTVTDSESGKSATVTADSVIPALAPTAWPKGFMPTRSIPAPES